jgi:two-component system response regulator
MSLHDGGVRPTQILLIDDGPVEAAFVKTIVRDIPVLDLMHVARDGAQAMAFLRQEGEYADAPLPDLILLDINMPNKDGFEVLSEIRDDPALCHLPIIMFTTSSDLEDVHRAHAAGANAYIIKPVDLADLDTTMRQLADFWGQAATLPKSPQERVEQEAAFWQI